MADICRVVVSEGEGSTSTGKSPNSLAARRRRIELRRSKCEEDSETLVTKRLRVLPDAFGNTNERFCELKMDGGDEPGVVSSRECVRVYPKYGMASVCGRRRDMEDAVAVHPLFCRCEEQGTSVGEYMHFFGVYDGHGCSHVATRCQERLHLLVKEELEKKDDSMKSAMEQSFSKMDKEVVAWNQSGTGSTNCRCELKTPDSDAVGSTAVTAVVTPNKIVVTNCGDSRAVLCRGGKAIPLSIDHKPDRPDELSRIEASGGRVIYWDGPRVLGVLAMSRAIGDGYLKPYVSSEPEVTETSRSHEDDCLILASDGLWDVVSNETACRVARMCLKGNAAASASSESGIMEEREAEAGGDGINTDKACRDASMLLTKLALARRSTDNVSVVVIDLRRDT